MEHSSSFDSMKGFAALASWRASRGDARGLVFNQLTKTLISVIYYFHVDPDRRRRQAVMTERTRRKSTMPIGEFSRISGIPISTLRYYDEIDLLKPADLDPYSLYRLYSPIQLHEANFIETWKALGFNLKEIKCLMSRGTGDLAGSCYQKQIAVVEEEIARQNKRKDAMARNLAVLNRFSGIPEEELISVKRKIIPEEFALTVEDPHPEYHGRIVEQRKMLDKLLEKHCLAPNQDGAFFTTRFLETCEDEGSRILYQLPLAFMEFPDMREIVKIPAHAALSACCVGSPSGIMDAMRRIRTHADERGMNVGKTISCVYWIDSSLTLDENLHVTEIRIPLKKLKPLDSQGT
jgi:DNA-binding transcriptional MerR regulator